MQVVIKTKQKYFEERLDRFIKIAHDNARKNKLEFERKMRERYASNNTA